jgi:hypothetical protein
MRMFFIDHRTSSPLNRELAALCLAVVLSLLYPTIGSAQQRAVSPTPTGADRSAPLLWSTVGTPQMSSRDAGEPAPSSSSGGTDIGVKDVNVAGRFLLEIGALGALGYWGFRTGESRLTRVALGVGAPLAAAVVWGAFASPNAPVQIAPTARIALQTAVFGGSAAALADAGRPRWAVGFATAVVINTVLMIAWDQ